MTVQRWYRFFNKFISSLHQSTEENKVANSYLDAFKIHRCVFIQKKILIWTASVQCFFECAAT